MQSQNIPPVYLALDKNWNIIISKIDVNSIFGHACDAEDIFFAFEYIWGKNQQLVKGALPRIDLVVMKNSDADSRWLRALEIKLTALPDNSTCHLSDDQYGFELVVRPNTIIHLTLEIASKLSRARRATLWIMKMLSDFAKHGKIDPQIVQIGFSKQTDKAFALSGRKTNPYMSCTELLQPRIRKNEIKNIILGHGERLLSPERRFDAILVNSPELFA